MADDLDQAGFLEAVRFTASTVDGIARRLAFTDDDVVAIVSSAALQLIARRRGKTGAIEHLRDVADVAERETLAESQARDPSA